MFIIWRGWGIVVPLIVVVCFVAGAMVSRFVGLKPPATHLVSAIALIVAGGVIWLISHRIENRPALELIEKGTGRQLTMRSSAGSLFFVPTRCWAIFLTLTGALLFAASISSYVK
jgi:hypothetical protein